MKGHSTHNELQELEHETTRLISGMARAAIGELSLAPTFRPYVARSNDRYSDDAHVRHSISSAVIAPRSYNAPKIDGFDGVYLQQIRVERGIVRLFAAGHTVAWWRDPRTRPSVVVELGKAASEPRGGVLNDLWRGNNSFGISTSGEADPSFVFDGSRRASKQLAVAGLVAHALLRAYGLDVGIAEARGLYAQLAASELAEPVSAEQPYWAQLVR